VAALQRSWGLGACLALALLCELVDQSGAGDCLASAWRALNQTQRRLQHSLDSIHLHRRQERWSLFCIVPTLGTRKHQGREKKRKEKKRKEKTTPFGVNLMRSQVLYRAAHQGRHVQQCSAVLRLGLS